jgi:hypothetical protein
MILVRYDFLSSALDAAFFPLYADDPDPSNANDGNGAATCRKAADAMVDLHVSRKTLREEDEDTVYAEVIPTTPKAISFVTIDVFMLI